MTLPKHYDPKEAEPRLSAFWGQAGVYRFSPDNPDLVFSIDTPPPTVSGRLHLGHVYSYSHPDFIARFWRMNGRNVYYPMGFDDNGLPTERLVETRLGITAAQVGRRAFIEKCLQISKEAEAEYQTLWQRLGLSIDWRFTYSTIDDFSRRVSQFSFIELYRKGLIYRREAPAIWCPTCRTALAQADLNDLERSSEYVILDFRFENGESLPIATTRPELLPACVAVFVNPGDARYRGLVGRTLTVPFYHQSVPVLEDPDADPQKGTGAVMCCTFGDTADVAWWYKHHLLLVQALDRDGRMTQVAGQFAGLPVADARRQIIAALESDGMILGRQSTAQTVRVHERCDTPVEFIMAPQWFIKVLEYKDELLRLGSQVQWHPEHMRARYQAWVENLSWDWCISRQRAFGVPFPLWICQECGQVTLADEGQLPIDPQEATPARPCTCGSIRFAPDPDVMDTWATSSMTPQIAGRWLDGARRDGSIIHPGDSLYERVFPFSLRPQAHEIIRTWAFYTILKSHYQFGALPWSDVLISGWGIAGEGQGKISKSRGGGPMPPMEMIELYSADAVRYWASSTGPGKDAVISEEKIRLGGKLVTKLWNVARFSERFLRDYWPQTDYDVIDFTSADRWILARLQAMVRRVTELMQGYEYASAKNELESFFWGDLADNYLEMCKQRLYMPGNPWQEGARYALYHVLLATLKMFAPFLPFITEEIYQGLFAATDQPMRAQASIHLSSWPMIAPAFDQAGILRLGESLVRIATAVRRFKSENNLPLGSELSRLGLATVNPALVDFLRSSAPDLSSICRASTVEIYSGLDPALLQIYAEGDLAIAVGP